MGQRGDLQLPQGAVAMAVSPDPDKLPLLLLIDGSHAVFRAYFAIRHLTSPAGVPTGAVFGFASMLLKLLRERTPARVAVCFDTSGPTHRHALDERYKANRPEMPEDLQVQWPVCQRVARELGLHVLTREGLEADDLIATLALHGQREGFEVLVVSGDKDLMQLVDDGAPDRPPIRQLDDGKGVLYGRQGVFDKWGVWPEQVGELLAIMGDSVDNIPGVKGIGEKGAVKLIQQWGTLANLYAHLDEVEPPRTQQLLRDSQPSALLARELVTLHASAELDLALDQLVPQPPDRPTAAATFASLGFKRLTAEFFDTVVPPAASTTVLVVQDAADLAALAAALRQTRQVALWTVTAQADSDRTRPLYAPLVGVAMAADGGRAWYLPIGHDPELSGRRNLDLAAVRDALGRLLDDPAIAKFGCNLKYELLVLGHAGLAVRGVAGDAALASYLYDAEAHAHTLRNIAAAYVGPVLPPDEALLGKGKAQTGWAQVAIDQAAPLLGQKAALCLRSCEVLASKLEEARVDHLYRELELPLVTVLAGLEARGITVDAAELAEQSRWLAGEIAALERTIWAHDGVGGPFNVGSPTQLAEVLFVRLGLPAKKKTQSGYSTDQSVLEGLEDKHPIAAQVLRWRQLTKLKSTYTDMLPGQILGETGRVHTWFAQAVAATGRLSSIDPNLQNIPVRTVEGRRIRQAFVAAPGCVLVSADYSQIELRVMAHLADDPGLQEAFRLGRDIHRETAARMFNLLPDLVDSSQRAAAKTINFGVLYGMGPQRLAREIGVSQKEAKAFIERYFERFPAVHRWMDALLAEARATSEVRTLFGRRRAVPGIHSANPVDRSAAERIAVNTPVQGTAADLIKRAMLAVDRALAASGLAATVLLQVHDELLVECPQAEAEAVAALLREAMAGAGLLPDGRPMKVPLQVDVRWARTWAEAH